MLLRSGDRASPPGRSIRAHGPCPHEAAVGSAEDSDGSRWLERMHEVGACGWGRTRTPGERADRVSAVTLQQLADP